MRYLARRPARENNALTMTLLETIRTLEAIALEQHSIAMVIENDVFKLNAIPNAKYAVFAYTQGRHTTSVGGDITTFQLTLFYIDRLTEDKSNQVEIQSTGTQVLRNILYMMSELDFEVSSMPIQPFNQRFADECAGVYCEVSIGASNGCECMPGFGEVLKEVSEATRDANEAADKANEAAERADASVAGVEEAISKANEAAERADTATTAANEAANKANSAAERVEDAVSNANEAADKANAASERADTSASNADKAAGNATSAAEAANTAASDADTAAAKADTSAGNADEQADRAKALADHPPKIVDVEGLKYWAFWDEKTKDYIVSDYRAEGGAIMPLFWVDPETLRLYVTYQNGYEGAKFKLENGKLYSIKTIEQ